MAAIHPGLKVEVFRCGRSRDLEVLVHDGHPGLVKSSHVYRTRPIPGQEINVAVVIPHVGVGPRVADIQSLKTAHIYGKQPYARGCPHSVGVALCLTHHHATIVTAKDSITLVAPFFGATGDAIAGDLVRLLREVVAVNSNIIFAHKNTIEGGTRGGNGVRWCSAAARASLLGCTTLGLCTWFGLPSWLYVRTWVYVRSLRVLVMRREDELKSGKIRRRPLGGKRAGGRSWFWSLRGHDDTRISCGRRRRISTPRQHKPCGEKCCANYGGVAGHRLRSQHG